MAFAEATNGFFPNIVRRLKNSFGDAAQSTHPLFDGETLQHNQKFPISDDIVITFGPIIDPLDDFTSETGAQFG